MRAVVQRVAGPGSWSTRRSWARSATGLCVLVGVTHSDDAATARRLADKIWHLRVMPDDDGVMNRSVADTTGEVLVVSQFTLYGDTSAGRRPSWIAAARPEAAEPLVDAVVERLSELGATVATGRFRAEMDVELVNRGSGDGSARAALTASGWRRAARRAPPMAFRAARRTRHR